MLQFFPTAREAVHGVGPAATLKSALSSPVTLIGSVIARGLVALLFVRVMTCAELVVPTVSVLKSRLVADNDTKCFKVTMIDVG
jgi:hypothetical protein